MNEKEIVKQLKEFRNTQNPFIIDKIIYDLEQGGEKRLMEKIEQNTSSTVKRQIDSIYQSIPESNTFSKRKEAIYKLLISNHLNQSQLEGYHINEKGMMEITDGSRIFILEKMEMIFEEKRKFASCKKKIEETIGRGKNKLKNYMELKLNISEIKEVYHHATNPQKIYQLNSYPLVQVNLSFLNDAIDILGEELTCYISKKHFDPVYFCNDHGEESILGQVLTYGEEVEEKEEEEPDLEWTTKYKNWTITYLDENFCKQQERQIRKYNMLAYKKLQFEIYPRFMEGEFQGKCVTYQNHVKEYELILPSDSLFRKVHGPLTLFYQVNEETKEVRVIRFEPADVLSEGHKSELMTYKGVLISKEMREKDMFKIDLLNQMKK